MVQSATQQQCSYRSSQTATPLNCGQQVLLDNPCAGKLDPHWSGARSMKTNQRTSEAGLNEHIVYW